MARHVLFVRFFLEYSETFPYDRVLSLPDSDVRAALEQLRDEKWADPNVQSENAKIESELSKRRKQWAKATGRPAKNSPSVPDLPDVFRIAEWGGGNSAAPGLEYGVSRRYALAICDDEQTAASACHALRSRADELARGAVSKGRLHGEDLTFASANPHFFASRFEDLPLDQQISAREQISRLDGPSKNPAIEEGLLRTFWAHFRKVLASLRTNPNSSANPSQDDRLIDPLIQSSPPFSTALEMLESLSETWQAGNAHTDAEEQALRLLTKARAVQHRLNGESLELRLTVDGARWKGILELNRGENAVKARGAVLSFVMEASEKRGAVKGPTGGREEEKPVPDSPSIERLPLTFGEWKTHAARMIVYCMGKDVAPPPMIDGNRDCESLVRICQRFRDKLKLDLDDWGLLEGEFALATGKTQVEINATPIAEIVAHFRPGVARQSESAIPPASEGTTTNTKPFIPLTSWAEIISAINESLDKPHFANDEGTRTKIRSINETYHGPIRLPNGKGQQPSVNKTALLEWWATLVDKYDARRDEDARHAKDTAATVESKHNYAATGTVVPDIAGSEKRRRRGNGKKGNEPKR
jgi:hypothetical protein